MNKEIIAEIRNKLQPSKTVLDMLSEGKTMSPEFIKEAHKNLDEAMELLSNLSSTYPHSPAL